jgi:DNA-binding NtrC family response regulator
MQNTPLSSFDPSPRLIGEPSTDFLLSGDSPAVQRLRSQVQRIAPYFRTALLRGETGTGKQLIARAIHDMSPAADGPFLVRNASALAEAIAAYGPTGDSSDRARPLALLESCNGGTLYLNGIGEIPFPLQAGLFRFIRALEERRGALPHARRLDIRIVAATHRDLRTLSAIGQFRQDLYARLSVVEMTVPPLRQRTEDIPLLSAHLLQKLAFERGKNPIGLTPESLAHLQQHTWPGNHSEMESVLAQATRHSAGAIIEPRHLMFLSESTTTSIAPAPVQKVERLQDVMERHMLSVLTRCAGNKLRAAELLGISRSTLYRMLDSCSVTGQALTE